VDLLTDPLTIAWPVFVVLTFGLIKLFIRFHRGLLVWGALIITGVFVLNHFSRGAGPMLREFDAASAMLSIQTTLAGYGERISATGPPEHRATAPSVPPPTPTRPSPTVTVVPTAASPNGTGGGVHPTADDPAGAKTTVPTAVPRATAPSVPPPTPTPTPTNVTAAPTAASPNETRDDDHPAAIDPEAAATHEPTAVPDDTVDAAAAPPTSAPDRRNCDPAYPEERTCIPPGPPLDEPCAITDERNFTVLPPDPRGLDTDRDGIGCEPFTP
jgi:hypothetical protein